MERRRGGEEEKWRGGEVGGEEKWIRGEVNQSTGGEDW